MIWNFVWLKERLKEKKEKRKKRRAIIRTILIIIIIFSSLVILKISLDKKTNRHISPTIQECIDNYSHSPNQKIIRTYLGIAYYSNISKEVDHLIDYYNLPIVRKYPGIISTMTVKVPWGREIEWKCILENSELLIKANIRHELPKGHSMLDEFPLF